jgi:hypothetical protein
MGARQNGRGCLKEEEIMNGISDINAKRCMREGRRGAAYTAPYHYL